MGCQPGGRYYTGPNQENMPRIRNLATGGPTGSSGPVLTNDTDPIDDPAEFICEFPGCERSFTTANGRGVHHRRAHPDWYDSRQITHKKLRWNPEEIALLARQEARLLAEGIPPRKINENILRCFPDRTLEAIKGQRRREDYKTAVRNYLQQQEDSTTTDDELEGVEGQAGASMASEECRNRIAAYLAELPSDTEGSYRADILRRVCQNVRSMSKDALFQEMCIYLRTAFPPKPARMRTAPDVRQTTPKSKRKERRMAYARIQTAWTRNPGNCLRSLLKDKTSSSAPGPDIMVPFWQTIMTSGENATPGVGTTRPVNEDLWAPILPKEITNAFPPQGTAPGPDGLTAKQLREIPVHTLTRILNLFLACGRIPTYLLESRTTLIPKKEEASEPGDFRPITVSSVLVRTFHKVLANRLGRLIKLDSRQRAFRSIDGCSENIFFLDFALQYHRKTFKPVYIASLDIAKAFDSVTHQAILDTLSSMGVPPLMVQYIKDVYERSGTRLQMGTWTSDIIYPNCGVKQGDPLSPVLFNMVMDRLFSTLPDDIGFRLGEQKFNALAFADDLLLLAQTPVGLQQLIDQTTEYLGNCGLRVNAGKSFTVAIKNVPKLKKSVVDAARKFKCAGSELPALRRSDEWKYLGVPFTPEGRVTVNPLTVLKDNLDVISKAPLKPQQRLFALRTMVLPGLYHRLALGRITISVLNNLDIQVRKAVRKWLALPHDVPNAYIHADYINGGLSVPSLRWNIPHQRYHRLRRIKFSEDTNIPAEAEEFKQSELKRTIQRLKDDSGETLSTLARLKKRWARLLHQSVDGSPLKESKKVKAQHRWVIDGNHFLSGRDYINSHRLRINAVPLRVRTARGQLKERSCRAGCRDTETLQHVLQICHRTHGPRVKRHDACVKYLNKQLQGTMRTEMEPHFRVRDELFKPDLIAISGSQSFVIDAQVVGERANLNHLHHQKIVKYKHLEQQIKDRYRVEKVTFTSLTLSSRGVWSEESAEDLVVLGLLKRDDLKILSSRVLIGGLHIINVFNNSTAIRQRIQPP